MSGQSCGVKSLRQDVNFLLFSGVKMYELKTCEKGDI